MKRHHSDDRGAALVEFVMVIGLLLTLVIGSVEMGFAFKDWLGVEAGSRAGARIAAQARDEVGADCRIVEAAVGAVRDLSGEVLHVDIYQSSNTGSIGATQRWRPFQPGDPAPTCGGWSRLLNGYPEGSAARQADDGTDRWIGVSIRFRHDWVTGVLLWTTSATWDGRTVMRIEPSPDPGI